MLKKLREQRGLSQRELADKAGTSGAYVAMLESGARKNPSIELLQKLAKALKTTVSELLK